MFYADLQCFPTPCEEVLTSVDEEEKFEFFHCAATPFYIFDL